MGGRPAAIARELAGLQNKVPPFSSDVARAIIESELGESLENVFIAFEDEPLASASIAQVHAARLADGREVVDAEGNLGLDIQQRR